MFEVFYISTGETYCTSVTYEKALRFVTGLTNCNDYDIRMAEDRWPEYESVREMEKYQ